MHNMIQHPSPNFQRFLDRLTMRSVLSDEEQQAILNLPGHAVQVQTNRDFVRLDEIVDRACLVVDGVIGRFGQNSQGARQITALHIAGDMPDLHSVVQPKSTSALQALSTATILRVPHKALREVTAEYPAVAEALWRDCMVDSAILSQWVVNVGRRDAKTRIAHLLCETAKRYKVDLRAAEIRFPFPLTQTHLADATGLTSVHVNRTLKSLRADGIADVGNRAVHILDWGALTTLGDFDADYLQADIKPEERIRIVKAG
jgi:CRP-like cAMP-binding protein